tara:strand:+ start:323 stop:595 length:273 start_codon:yes stop_codon:yes gene_type:complete
MKHTLSEEEKGFVIKYLNFKIPQTKNKLRNDYYRSSHWKEMEKEWKEQWEKELKIAKNLFKKLVKIEKITLSNVDDVSDIIVQKIIKGMR